MGQLDMFDEPEPTKPVAPKAPYVEPLGSSYNVGLDNVSLVRCMAQCSNCGGMFPIARIGLRRMGDGTIRNQPRCGPCRKYK